MQTQASWVGVRAFPPQGSPPHAPLGPELASECPAARAGRVAGGGLACPLLVPRGATTPLPCSPRGRTCVSTPFCPSPPPAGPPMSLSLRTGSPVHGGCDCGCPRGSHSPPLSASKAVACGCRLCPAEGRRAPRMVMQKSRGSGGSLSACDPKALCLRRGRGCALRRGPRLFF